MRQKDLGNRLAAAAAEFDSHQNRNDGMLVAERLAEGLEMLRDSLYLRLHIDVERAVRKDSMLMPVSEEKAENSTKLETELFQIAVSTATAEANGYANTADHWYGRWLTGLQLGEAYPGEHVAKRLAFYAAKGADQKRLVFTDVLARTLPESRRAPLVMFRLMPLSAEIVTALAFGHRQHAVQVRQRQLAELPAINDCRQCHGELLENGQQRPNCGNPMWKFPWLVAAD